ncbi:hypothetical protein JCM1841_004161 [Sporobolomyces salmonicolor]
MGSLDPSHIPGLERTSDLTTGQAVHDSVSPLHALSAQLAQRHTGARPPSGENAESVAPFVFGRERDADHPDTGGPSWKGAWKRRQEAKNADRPQRNGDGDGDDGDEHSIQMPVAVPDLRFEQGVLASIRPFLHVAAPDKDSGSAPLKEEKHQAKLEAAGDAALASVNLTAEGNAQGRTASDVLMGPLSIEWSKVVYVIVRDQVVFPLLQGVLWGMAGIWLNGLWSWNRARLAAKSGGPRRSAGPSLLARFGLSS